MRPFAAALVLASIAVASPAFSQVWSPARIAKVKAQISIQEGRAAALQPIVASDITARDAILTNAVALDQIATEEAAQALEYREMAATAPNQKTQDEFIGFAEKLETFADRSSRSATTRHELARALDKSIQNMLDAVAFHLQRVVELKTALAANS